MRKIEFFTEEFYTQPNLIINVLNKCLEKNFKHVNDYDTYESGEILIWEIAENERTLEILKPVISDIEAYKKQYKEDYGTDADTQIGLSLLADSFSQYHKYGELEIRYDKARKKFMHHKDYFKINQN
jgi:hypothetical protein